MKKVLIGLIVDGKAGGVDRYILDFYKEIHGTYAQVDFLTSSYTEELAEKLKQNGSKLLECPHINDLVGQYRSLKRIVSENKYDVVYFNYSTAIGWTAVKGAHDGGAREIIVHSHASAFCDTNNLKQFVYTCLHYLSRPFLRKYATALLSCSDKAAIWMFGKGALRKGRVTYIKNEVDSSVYARSAEKRRLFRERYRMDDNFIIGNVGTMLKPKNQHFLIGLLPELKRQIPNAKVFLVGEGETKEGLMAYAQEIGVSDDVIFAGYVDSSEGIMNAFDVFCLPSYAEGYPYVAIEAQMLDLPCIFSKGVTEQVRCTDRCTYLSLRDPKLWVKQLVAEKNAGVQSPQRIEQKDSSAFTTRREYMASCVERI